jgi:hypothetical protein
MNCSMRLISSLIDHTRGSLPTLPRTDGLAIRATCGRLPRALRVVTPSPAQPNRATSVLLAPALHKFPPHNPRYEKHTLMARRFQQDRQPVSAPLALTLHPPRTYTEYEPLLPVLAVG